MQYESSNYLSGAVPDWNVTNGNLNYCGYIGVVQNGNSILEKNITNLTSHYKFELELGFEGLEGFTGNTLNVYYDGVIKATYSFPMNTSNYTSVFYKPPAIFGTSFYSGYFWFKTPKNGFALLNNTNLCGSSTTNENIYLMKIIAEHNSSTISLKLAFSNYSSPTDYWKLNYYNYKISTKAISTTCGSNCTDCDSSNCRYCGGTLYNQDDVCVLCVLSDL